MISIFKSGDGQWKDFDAFAVPAGKFDSVYGKTLSLHVNLSFRGFVDFVLLDLVVWVRITGYGYGD